MKRIIITGLVSLSLFTCPAQHRIEDCYSKAQANYPLIKQYDLIEKTKEYTLSNAGKAYLPQISFSAKASYQSDVTQLPTDLGMTGIQGISIPALSKDQYNAAIDVSQTVWDGGVVRLQKESIRSAAEVEAKSNAVNMYSINERVNQLFFGILLADEQMRQNQLLQQDLKRNFDQVKAYMQNGIANQADLDAIRVSQLKAGQNYAQLAILKKAYIEILSKLTGETLSPDTEFEKPKAKLPDSHAINRPELSLFDAQIRNLENNKNEINARLYPKLGVFATGGVGKPGLNMLENEFSPYFLAGARITWNFGGFYTQKNNKNLIDNNISRVETQRDIFLFNTNLDIVQKQHNIAKCVEQLKYDDEIIALRTSVRQASEAKMANGTISGSDLTREINAEQNAIQEKTLHEMELLLAIYNLKFATNN